MKRCSRSFRNTISAHSHFLFSRLHAVDAHACARGSPEARDSFFFLPSPPPAKWRVNAAIPRRLIRPIKQTRSFYYSL